MNEKRPAPADPLAGFAPPGAPPELKARVLAASRAALLDGPVSRDRWALLWENRPLRLAWAASLLLLLAGHAVLLAPGRPQGEAAALPLSRSVSGADAELAAIGRLPRLDPEARSIGGGPGDASTPSRPSRSEQPKETRS